eukprot:3122584-Alexandrium_andersonii.AAC.1
MQSKPAPPRKPKKKLEDADGEIGDSKISKKPAAASGGHALVQHRCARVCAMRVCGCACKGGR